MPWMCSLDGSLGLKMRQRHSVGPPSEARTVTEIWTDVRSSISVQDRHARQFYVTAALQSDIRWVRNQHGRLEGKPTAMVSSQFL